MARLTRQGLDGDILVFLPGAAEIRRAQRSCAELAGRAGLMVLPLYGDLAPAELMRIDICWSAASGLALIDTVRGADFQTRHLLLALNSGERYRIARGPR